jgi:hypothetical protein
MASMLVSNVVEHGFEATTKTGRHDIAEILLKVALNTINQSINQPKIYRYDNNLQFFSSTILIKGGKSGQL